MTRNEKAISDQFVNFIFCICGKNVFCGQIAHLKFLTTSIIHEGKKIIIIIFNVCIDTEPDRSRMNLRRISHAPRDLDMRQFLFVISDHIIIGLPARGPQLYDVQDLDT